MPTACPGSGEFVAAQKQGKEQYNPGMCCNVGVYIERHGSIPQKHVEERARKYERFVGVEAQILTLLPH